MKPLTVLLLLVFLATYSVTISAQQSSTWIKIAPSDERFTIYLPNQPKVEQTTSSYGGLTAEGRTYSTSADGATYTVWSLTTETASSNRSTGIKVLLDVSAALVWESLLKPTRDALPKADASISAMTFKSEVSVSAIPGREYTLRLGDSSGAARIYMNDARLYVLVGLGAGGKSVETETFFRGFVVKSINPLDSIGPTVNADPLLVAPDSRSIPNDRPVVIAPPPGNPRDYNRVFHPNETTRRARIISKPEPQYTDAARSHNTVGVVMLSAILTKDGRIVRIRVVKGQPHGLTEVAIEAARKLRFVPATKDGHNVSQYIRLEYDFNLY